MSRIEQKSASLNKYGFVIINSEGKVAEGIYIEASELQHKKEDNMTT